MKNFAKLFVIAAIAAAIGFSMIACGGGGGGGGSPVDPNSPNNPNNPGVTWAAGDVARITWHLNEGFIFDNQKGYYLTQIEKGKVLKNPFDYDDINPAKSSHEFGGWYEDSGLTQLYAFGSPVTADLNLYAKWGKIGIIPGGNDTTLVWKLNWLKQNAQSDTVYKVYVANDETIDPQGLSYPGKSNITLILVGIGSDSEKVISSSGNGQTYLKGLIFRVEKGVTLILDKNITLKGISTADAAMVQVWTGGELEMRTGAKITGNSLSRGTQEGSGVTIGGTFIMNGGEISGHNGERPAVAGVAGASFVMNGGKISNNTNAGGDAGGVYMGAKSKSFTMNGGEISGNTNTDPTFGTGGVCLSQCISTMNGGKISGNNGPCGGVRVRNTTFTMNGGEISGNTGTRGGGGVAVDDGTSSTSIGNVGYSDVTFFIMNGGTISGNTAHFGGGVFMGAGKTAVLRIVNGTIYGGSAPGGLRNSATAGAALVFSSGSIFMGSAESGTFSGSTWNKTTDIFEVMSNPDDYKRLKGGPIDADIKVVNGNLQ